MPKTRFALCVLLAATSAHAQQVRVPQWSPDRPDASANQTASSSEEAEPEEATPPPRQTTTERREQAGSELDIGIGLSQEPRVASLSSSTGADALVIADSIVNLDGLNHSSPPCPTCSTCQPAPRRRFGLFAEALLLRPGGAGVVYAIEQTGCDPVLSTPTGQVGEISPDVAGGLRLGGVWFLRSGAEIVGSYTWLPSNTGSSIAAQPGTVLASQVTHPSLASCGDNSLSASASQDIELNLLDLDYRASLCSGCPTSVHYLAGVRFARLEQQFAAAQLTGAATGLSTVGTDVTFAGMGFRLGMEGERHNPCNGFLIYARGMANFLGGDFNARYRQVNQFGGAVPIAMNYEDYRLVSVLEAELGVGWQSPGGHWRLTGGYQSNAWFNTLTTRDYIRGVRAGAIDDLSDTLTFDGLVARVEWRR